MKKSVILVLAVMFLLVVALGGTAAAGGGFDEFGYNYTARIFNGTGESWSLAKGLPTDYLGIYAHDKLIMKWNAEWDRGNAEGWSNPPYNAWEDNEWNGMKPGGSGAVWHYKIIWVGSEMEAGPYWREGGYPIWGQFEVIMDQGIDPSYGPGHMWFAKAIPCGYDAK
ncbi:MAG: hypothetical protein WC891_06945 [Actinomycetota bacterium]